MTRKRHPERVIEDALRYAESRGWRVEPSRSHAHSWGKMYCPHMGPGWRCGEFCITSIWSTPRSSVNHARQILRVVDGCDAAEDGVDQ